MVSAAVPIDQFHPALGKALEGVPSTGPKASMSGFHRLAQLRPGAVVRAIVSPAGPGSMVAACTASRSWSRCFHALPQRTRPSGPRTVRGPGRVRLGGSHR